jgi:hypothetical protein
MTSNEIKNLQINSDKNVSASPLYRRLGALSWDSLRTLFRFKSFFLLVFVVIWADRGLRPFIKKHTSEFNLAGLKDWTIDLPHKIFEQLPAKLLGALVNPKTFLILIILFLIKQMISLWPSNDMRRMHRRERGNFGLWESMLALTWRQMLWDATALGSLAGIMGAWVLTALGACRIGWLKTASPVFLIIFIGLAGMVVPLLLAGFSFSSKLAILQKGKFNEKLGLYFKIFTDLDLGMRVWSFFTLRVLFETTFVVLIPGLILVYMTNPWLRILLASLLATPVYAFLKMISFKFFLDTYGRFDLVYAEYESHYRHGA